MKVTPQIKLRTTLEFGMDHGCGHGYGPSTESVHSLQIAGRYYYGGKAMRCQVEAARVM